MPDITLNITDHEGERLVLAGVPTDMGLNLKDYLIAAGLPVQGQCGGQAECSTCHCYIVRNGQPLFPLSERRPQEQETLLQSDYQQPASRLSCQVVVSEILDGAEIILTEDTLG
jgi:ferredoxin